MGALTQAPWHCTISTPNILSSDSLPTLQQVASSTALSIMSEPRNIHGVVVQTLTLNLPLKRLKKIVQLIIFWKIYYENIVDPDVVLNWDAKFIINGIYYTVNSSLLDNKKERKDILKKDSKWQSLKYRLFSMILSLVCYFRTYEVHLRFIFLYL